MNRRGEPTLVEQAQAVLQRNWTGRFTKPSPRLYPYQWSWDSAYIAIGYAHYDLERAQKELRTLFAGQWRNGLLPHIIFNFSRGPRVYFPGPDFWQTRRSPHAPKRRRTSGIVQPPIHATAVLRVYQSANDGEQVRPFLAEIFPKLKAWHEYLYRERDPYQEGLVYIRHPWESGQDNSPIWDNALARMELKSEQIPAYRRVDTQTVDAAERPTDSEYDRYIYLVRMFSERNYDEAAIWPDCPFLVQDVVFNTLLCQANRDLAEIAHILGEDGRLFIEWADQTGYAINQKLWSKTDRIYYDYDLNSKELITEPAVAGFIPLFAHIPDQTRAQNMYGHLNSDSFWKMGDSGYPVPSYDKHAPKYLPNRYWRGPVWMNMDWLLAQGLEHYGYQAYADALWHTIVELPKHHGFFEYFDPRTGTGYGAYDFSWTAALLIDTLERKPHILAEIA
ncbi:MAG: glycoside hydrolase [Chloroflexi bacterium]|nr:MAG: glycoside hydrolase [Chloroflexota bacterium]